MIASAIWNGGIRYGRCVAKTREAINLLTPDFLKNTVTPTGSDNFVLAFRHFMGPGYAQSYRYIWQDGVWSSSLNIAENSSGRSGPIYVGAAGDTPLIRCVYHQDGILKTRTESNGQLQVAQTIIDYLAARGYTQIETPFAYFTDVNGGLHLLVCAQWNGIVGVYYVHP